MKKISLIVNIIFIITIIFQFITINNYKIAYNDWESACSINEQTIKEYKKLIDKMENKINSDSVFWDTNLDHIEIGSAYDDNWQKVIVYADTVVIKLPNTVIIYE